MAIKSLGSKVFIFDVEIFSNFFCVTFLNVDTDKKYYFEISERTNDYSRLQHFINSSKKEYFVVGFNSLNYDEIILRYMFKNNFQHISWNYICSNTKRFSDVLIYGQNLQKIKYINKLNKKEQLELFDEKEDLIKTNQELGFNYSEQEWFEFIKPYKWNNQEFSLNWTTVDLYLYWSKGLRISKKLSLKALGIQLNYPVVMELPYPHNHKVHISEIPTIIKYNSIHDIGVTKLLYENMKEQINLRKTIKDFDAMSYDAPKIASETLLHEYCKVTGKDKKEVRNTRNDKTTFYFKDYLPYVEFKTDIFKEFYNDLRNSSNQFSKELTLCFGDKTDKSKYLKISYGIGGVHSTNNNQQWNSDENTKIITSDVASLYPTLVENLSVFPFKEVQTRYNQLKTERLTNIKPTLKAAKKAGNAAEIQKWSLRDDYAKLLLNGVTGLLDSEYNWLYNPIPITILRIYGQLILSRLTEECLINNIQVISLNTDGAEVLLNRNQEQTYFNIIKEIEKEFSVVFESEYYKFIYYINVNSYIAMTETGSIKQKGQFVTKPVLGNSTDHLVVAKALNEYFINNIQPEEVINNPYKYGLTIYDFCISKKIDKKYSVLYKNERIQQLNRFYISQSKDAAYLQKQKNTKSNPDYVIANYSVKLFNDFIYYDNFDEYQIDKRFYLKKIKDIIYDLEKSKIQLSLF